MLADGARPESRSHGASLPLLVADVLAEARVALDEVDALAVSIGPGSFTGLRIGLGWAKGVALAGGIPIVPVGTLDALAHVAGAAPGERICAALDARKSEVYAALYAMTEAGPEPLGAPEALRPADLARRLVAPIVLVGDAAEVYRDVLAPHARLLPFATHHPRGSAVARLGAELLARGGGRNPGDVEPVYVRPPEAELTRAGSR